MIYKSYEQQGLRRQSVQEIKDYLKSLKHCIEVIDVQDDPFFRQKGIRIIFLYKVKSGAKIMTIEVQAMPKEEKHFVFEKRAEHGDNNFLFSRAEYLFYYFVSTKKLYLIPIGHVRTWFIAKLHSFELATVQRREGNRIVDHEAYIVPISDVISEGVQERNINRYLNSRQGKLEV